MRIQGSQINLVLVDGYTAVHNVTAQFREDVAWQFPVIPPLHLAGNSIDRDDLVEGRRHINHPVDSDCLAVLTFQNTEGQIPHRTQFPDVVLVDLLERAVARGLIVTTIMEPVAGVLVGVEKHVVRHIVWIQLRLSRIQPLPGNIPRGTQRRNGSQGQRRLLERQLLHH
jgi:hypothetical protein